MFRAARDHKIWFGEECFKRIPGDCKRGIHEWMKYQIETIWYPTNFKSHQLDFAIIQITKTFNVCLLNHNKQFRRNIYRFLALQLPSVFCQQIQVMPTKRNVAGEKKYVIQSMALIKPARVVMILVIF